jgi:protein translocase SecG subunit
MFNLFVILQLVSGLLTAFFVLAHDPKSEGLGAIGGSANHFKGMQSSADDKLNVLTWIAASTFMLCSLILGLKLVV